MARRKLFTPPSGAPARTPTRTLTGTPARTVTDAPTRIPACTLAALLLASSLLPTPRLPAQDLPWQSSNATSDPKTAPAVRYEYPEQITLPASKPSLVELHFRIRDGLHINSHAPLQKSLIRTDLIVAEPSGVTVSSVDFPAGADYALKALPNEKLSVYTGEVVLRAHLSAQPGQHLVKAALRYQACDADSCYPPRQTPIALDIVAR